jgi:hypothetical protein
MINATLSFVESTAFWTSAKVVTWRAYPMAKSEFSFFSTNLIAWRCHPSYLSTKQGEAKMATLIAFVVGVPIAAMLSVWSDVGTIQETINKRKLDASLLSMPGDYHTL